MPQVSKIDECLNFHNYAIAKDPASNTQANQTTKQDLLTIILEALPEKNNLSQKYENLDKNGGIDTTLYDSDEDPNYTKNGEALAHLAQFAGDTGYNTALDEVREALNGVFGVEG